MHTVVYAVVLVAITAVIPLDASFGGDDGAYGGQAHALGNGGWALERPLPVVDEDNEGWLNTTVTPDGPVVYTANPGYAIVLRHLGEAVAAPSGRAGDRALGYRSIPVLGALASAAVAWMLTRTVAGDRSADWTRPALAFWLVALGPVLVNATTLWAHTLSSALAGASLWSLRALARADERDLRVTSIAVAGLATSLVGAAAVRTEAVFWIAAIGITAAVVIRRRVALLGAWTGVAAGLLIWVVNRSWGAALRADGLPVDTAVVESEGGEAWLASRIPAAWRLLLTSLGGGLGPIVALVGVVFVVLAARSLRSATADRADRVDGHLVRQHRIGAALLLGSVACVLAHGLLAPGETISGTVAAWPIVVVLLVAGGRIGATSGSGRLLVLVLPVLLFSAAVLATQYSISGGHQWGGRYLSLAFVPLAVVAAIRGAPLVALPTLRPALLALLLAPAVLGVLTSYELHARHRALATATTEIPAEVVITPVVALPRLAWTELPTAYYLADESTIDGILHELAAAGVESVNVHRLDDVTVDGTAGYRLTATTDAIRHLELAASS